MKKSYRCFLRIVVLLSACWLSGLILLASEHHGQVAFGGLPVPGVAVTATQGDKKVTAITDGMGSYSFPDLADGKWTFEISMSGFATVTKDLTVGPGAPSEPWELKLKSISEIQAKVQAPVLATEPRPAQAAPAKPTAPAPAKPKPTVQAAAQGTAAAGGRGGTPAPAAGAAATPPADQPSEASQQAADGFLVNGSQVNGGSSPFALNPAFGNNRRGPRSLYNYQLVFNNINLSELNARSFSQTGQDTPKPQTTAYQINGLVQGPLRIPHILRNGPTFFIQYALVRNRNSSTSFGLVPTDVQRNGDLSSVTSPIFNPLTQAPFAGNIIPQRQLSPQAQALLSYFPPPNFNSTQYNYQIPIVQVQHQDIVNTRLQKQIGRKNSITGTFAFTSTRMSTPNLFGFLDPSSTLGINLSPQWNHQWTNRFRTNFQYSFSRNASHQYSNFENKTNVSGVAGITGNLQSPAYWGPPSLNFGATGLIGLSDGSPSFNRPQTQIIQADNYWTRGRHNVQFGADFRRQDYNYFSESNARGSFTFDGTATAVPGIAGSGSALADFLLGIPDLSQIAYGNPDKYLRASTYDAYIQDDWRVNSALTINGGMRWEYSAPISELYGRLVNLDVAPGFSAVAPVLGNAPVGSLTGQNYSSSLMHPDKHGFEPGVGIAWRPISGSSLVVRAGYGLRYSTSVYQAIIGNLDQQYPLSTSSNATNSPTTPLTLANGFNTTPATESPLFGIDPNFRIGYSQNWFVSIQKDLPAGMQMVVRYDGIKGTRLPEMFYPNSWAPGGPNPCPSCPVGFQYETSNGNSTREAGYIQLRRRLHNGFQAQGQYTYSKSIDDLPSGQAQNWLNLSGERGLSTFDQRQNVTVQLQYTSGLGIGGGNFLSGWRAATVKEWTFLVPITWGTGLPLNPNYNSAALGGTTTYAPLRPSFTGEPLYTAQGGLFLNPGAFAAPAAGTYGNAGKDSVTGPDQFSLNASMQRTFRVNDRVTLNLRVDSVNALNHPVPTSYGTTYGSPQLGVQIFPTSGMRKLTTTLQFRF